VTLPTVDVLFSTFNEEAYAERALRSVLDQDLPADRMRIWIVDGGSTDGTVDVLRRVAGDDPRVELIADGVRRNLPEALNVALERADGELAAKIDAHGWAEPDYLRRCAEALASDPRLGCVGGRPVQEGETPFARALVLARGSKVGVGASEYAGDTEVGEVETVQCGVYRRAALDDVGFFDAELNYGEDEELNLRVRQGGWRIVLDTRIRFHYIARPTWKAAYRQYRNYGQARVGVVRKHPSFLRPYHLVPAAAVAGGATLAVLAPVSGLARRTLAGGSAAYAGIVGAGALAAARERPASAPRVASALVALHAGYGIGMLRGVRDLLRAGP
jgi:succinoglycan biosynthesis protein ExoA